MVVEFTRIALERERRKKSLEKIRFGSRIARDVQFETKNADFLLGISFYAVSIQKKKRGKGSTEIERFHGRSGREFTIIRRDGMYECPSCRNLYKWKKSMLSHLRNQCRQPPRFECPHCSMKNYQKSHMIRHLRVHHPQLAQTFWDRKFSAFFRF